MDLASFPGFLPLLSSSSWVLILGNLCLSLSTEYSLCFKLLHYYVCLSVCLALGVIGATAALNSSFVCAQTCQFLLSPVGRRLGVASST